MTYMFRTWQIVFQQPQATTGPQVTVKDYGDGWLAPALLIACCVGLGLFAAPLVLLAEQAVTALLDPMAYIRAVNLYTMGG